jgi:hypothetical protein
VAGDKRIASEWRVTIDKMEISATESTCLYPYHHFVWLWFWIGHLANPNIARSVYDYRSHIILPLVAK